MALSLGGADVVVGIKVAIGDMKKDLREATKQIRQGVKLTDAQMNGLLKSGRRLRMLRSVARSVTPPFQQWAVVVGAAGLIILRTLGRITKAASATFREVMGSVDGTVTGFDMLEGSFKYLQFAIGQALEPVAMMLLPIIDSMADWVSNNQEAFLGMLKFAVILGGVMATLGIIVKLGLGLWQMWLAVATVVAKVWGVLKFVGIGIGKVVAVLGGPLTLAIVAIIAAIILIIVYWKDIKAIAGKVAEWIVDKAKDIGAGFKKAFQVAGNFIEDLFVGIVNSIQNLFGGFLKFILSSLKKIIEIANKIPGVDISTRGIQSTIDSIDAAKANRAQASQQRKEERAIRQAPAPVTVNVELDGEKVSKSVSTRQLTQFERYIA